MCVKACGKLGKWPPNVLILHPFLSPSTARCCHMLESRWDQFVCLSGLPCYDKRMQHSKMPICLIRVVGAQGVIRNNKIPVALSGHTQRSPPYTGPPSWSTSPQEASLTSYSPMQMSSAAWPLKTSQLQQPAWTLQTAQKREVSLFCHLQLIQNQCVCWEFGCWTRWREKLYSAPAFPEVVLLDKQCNQKHNNPELSSQR